MTKTFGDRDLYVSPDGRDSWSGDVAEPTMDGTDGPLQSIVASRDVLRGRRTQGEQMEPVTVWLRGGDYPVTEPLTFEPQDSGPITYASYPGEDAVITSAVTIEGRETTTIHGQTAWVTDVSEHLEQKSYFRSLFVNGERRGRPRLPKKDFFWMADVPDISLEDSGLFDGSRRFEAKEGDLAAWSDIQDADIVVMHFWVDDRMPIESYDPKTRMLTSSRKSIFALKDDWSGRWAKYYVDNVFEALTEPGEWYLHRRQGKLYYLPLPGETLTNTTITVPSALQLLRLAGDPVAERYVEFLQFKDLTFRHTDWTHASGLPVWYDPYRAPRECRRRDSWKPFIEHNGTDPNTDYATVPQGAIHLPGAIFLEGARHCALENCRVENIGWYGIDLGEGCVNNSLTHNTISDMGAGGIKMDGGDHTSLMGRRTGHNRISDNHIHGGGKIAGASTGIILVHAFGNYVGHNHIHDMLYTGISCGWVWGYAENVSRDNTIEKNHIHDIGQGILSDMGGIYCLGVQPGTVVRGNLIHDVTASNYGGIGIYLDEGSSHMVIEDNIVYNVSTNGYEQHFGRENMVRNNVFALAGESPVQNTKGPREQKGTGRYSFTLMQNIILTKTELLGCQGFGQPVSGNCFWASRNNLFWSVGEGIPRFTCKTDVIEDMTLDALQAAGGDIGSVMADPGFKDPTHGDFALPENSPAYRLGFRTIDMRDVGPRPI